MKYRYKNISEHELILVNVGEIKAGAVVESDVEINNPNLELLEDSNIVGKDPVTKTPKRK